MMEANDMRSLSRDARHERRVQVIRLRKAGQTYKQIAAQTGLSVTGVFNICGRHDAGGAEALRDAPTGRKTGDKRRLTAAQEKTIQQFIVDKTPDQMKLPYALWNRAAVARLIHERLDIDLPVRTVGLYLTVTNKGTMRWKIFDGALNADILIEFLRRLVRDAQRKVGA